MSLTPKKRGESEERGKEDGIGRKIQKEILKNVVVFTSSNSHPLRVKESGERENDDKKRN